MSTHKTSIKLRAGLFCVKRQSHLYRAEGQTYFLIRFATFRNRLIVDFAVLEISSREGYSLKKKKPTVMNLPSID